MALVVTNNAELKMLKRLLLAGGSADIFVNGTDSIDTTKREVTIELFTTGYTMPTDTDTVTVSDLYGARPGKSGYSPITLLPNESTGGNQGWIFATDASGITSATYFNDTDSDGANDGITFTFNSDTYTESISGYFVRAKQTLDGTAEDLSASPKVYGELLWFEVFEDGPYNIPEGGGSIKLIPKIELS